VTNEDGAWPSVSITSHGNGQAQQWMMMMAWTEMVLDAFNTTKNYRRYKFNTLSKKKKEEFSSLFRV
jgi:hypothetical protein